ncbi:3-dehydroquinate synthase [Rivihabitans pingtungensis]|jgi:3-dehydroquinate synthase|uniref:3-dehydroquinate synthase n=1 Tax=Rivihabitans pingtungensis TaxID=1054498 RepID=A0A318L5H7_9NEIS|nr:3-dehydroquinate synthase [Rivihabitans pingtungensis]PXX80743.1 3-dehydroquinate synthase [Rivihabitans pingtungensis]HNX71030.1 3-dehydroquinate synthase [Rivihabitans pingtungensis]
MITLDLVLPDTRYPIYIGESLYADAARIVAHLPQKKAAIITNETIAPLYLAPLQAALEAAGVAVTPVILPDGEAYKTWETLNLIFDALLGARAERKTTLIALGGGVIGDMTGFAAACYQRGAPFIQIPTTLLAQVDSSVGGKTAINHPLGKNMIGAFYQPRAVLADMAVLDTLPERELSAGLAEVIKYALLGDVQFLAWLEQHIEALRARDRATLAEAVRHCCQMKADIVGEDEKETGVRALLNLGHTFGHAIEAGMGYGAWLHGEAVAAGMVLAAETSRLLGWISEADVARVTALIERAGLPILSPDLGVDAWISHMGHDKKVEEGQLRFVLLRQLGQAVIEKGVPLAVLREVLQGRFIRRA